MPSEVLPDAFLCDKDCSEMDADEDDIIMKLGFPMYCHSSGGGDFKNKISLL